MNPSAALIASGARNAARATVRSGSEAWRFRRAAPGRWRARLTHLLSLWRRTSRGAETRSGRPAAAVRLPAEWPKQSPRGTTASLEWLRHFIKYYWIFWHVLGTVRMMGLSA